jgi:ABC-type uncharacterized transport system auxiliary subunit
MKRTACILASLALLAACSSMPVKRYFQIGLAEFPRVSIPRLEKSVRVAPVDVDPFYDDFRIIYRVSTYELRYYPYEYWAKKPSLMLRVAAAEMLAGMRAFSQVSADDAGAEADFVLRMKVRVMEEVDSPNAWQGRLAADLEFVEGGTGQTLLAHSFDRKATMRENKVETLPAALTAILSEELQKAVSALADKLGYR